jgi:diguanylate cyclase (GGDEF)-like protein
MSFASPSTDHTTLQLVRYEALFKLIDDIQEFDDISTIAKKVATQWKYFANIVAWHLVIPNGNTFEVIDGFRGEAHINNVDKLCAWDQYHRDLRRPHLIQFNDGETAPEIPAHLVGKGIVNVMVLPFSRQGDCTGLLSVAARGMPFSELDKKFIRIFGKHLTDRFASIILRRQTHRLLVEKATHDALTGLLNRGTIVDWLGSKLALAKRASEPLSILLIDIDYFKRINDHHGHLAGDAVLQQVAQRLKEQTRDGDSLGRYGGEEFLVVLFPCDHEAAMLAAERVRKAIADSPFKLPAEEGKALDLTISLGMACTTGLPPETSIAALLKLADDALYRSKATGRNCVTAAALSNAAVPEGAIVEPAN